MGVAPGARFVDVKVLNDAGTGTEVGEGIDWCIHNRARDWDTPDSLAPLITQLNTIRRRHPALQRLRNLRFHHTDNNAVIAYSKRTGDDTVLVVVNLDPHHTQEATVSLDMPQLGLERHESLSVHDELTGETYHWSSNNYVRLEPGRAPAHVFHVRRSAPQTGGTTP
jgi:starch synthase (maltosyl-transferring)